MQIKAMETSEEMEGKAYVHYQAFQETYVGLWPQEFLANLTIENCQEIAHTYPENTLIALVDGQVVGFALMQAVLGKLQSYDQVCLWVLEGNERAISFYQKVGFVFNGMTKTVNLGQPCLERRMLYQRR